MGYTHYWYGNGEVDRDSWVKLKEAVIGVLSIAKAEGIVIVGGMGDAGTQPLVNEQLVSLNGLPSHETFYLERCMEVQDYMRHRPPEQQRFAFCKTAYKPYDVVVTAILCLAEHLSGGVYRVSSDGDAADWQQGLALANRVMSGVPLPAKVRDPEGDEE